METPKPSTTLNDLHSRRHTLRTKHIRYQKTSKDLLEKLANSKDASAGDIVKDVYSLLRLFSLTYNQVNACDDQNKATLPGAFTDELKKILTEANYNKIDETFKVRGQDFAASLPASLDKSIVEQIVNFVKSKETDHINARYEKDLAELTTQIDGRKGEVKARPERKKRNGEQDAEDSLEEQMTVLLKKINNKARGIRLQKDDFQAYSDAQAQFDLLFDDVAMEIMKMKKNLRVKFDKVQGGRNSNNNRGSKAPRGNNQRDNRERREPRENRDDRKEK